MPLARRVAALVAAALALALGARGLATRTDARRDPVNAVVLRSLVMAPIPAGSTALLVPPLGLSEADQGLWLMEAVWQRPDLRWQLAAEEERRATPASFCAVVGEAGDITGWRVIARLTGLTILQRDRR